MTFKKFDFDKLHIYFWEIPLERKTLQWESVCCR